MSEARSWYVILDRYGDITKAPEGLYDSSYACKVGAEEARIKLEKDLGSALGPFRITRVQEVEDE